MHWPNEKTLAGTIAAAVVVGITVYMVQQHRIASLELQRQSAIAERDEAVAGREEALTWLKLKEQQLKSVQQQNGELLALRGEAARLRDQVTKQKEQRPPGTLEPTGTAPTPQPGDYISKEQLAFVGFSTPERCWESCIWAMFSGNFDAMTNSFGPEMQREFGDPQMKAEFEATIKSNTQNFGGMQVLARKEIAEDKVELKILMHDKTDEISIQPIVKVGDEWKRQGNSRGYTAEWEKSGTVETFTR